MDPHSEAETYVQAMRDIIGRHLPTTSYSVKHERGNVEVAVGKDTFSFAAVLLNNQALSELDLALRDATNRSDDPVQELVLQLRYLTESEKFR